jgi:predicted MFS family arabinose efflux permease
VLAARKRVCWISAVVLLATAAIPLMPTPSLAAAAISLSFFWTLCISANVYAMPIDLFGRARAGFGVAALTFAFGMMQTLVSPLIGAMVDRFGFTAVCILMSAMPLVGVGILHISVRDARP